MYDHVLFFCLRMQGSLNRLLLIAVVWQDSHSVHAAKKERERLD